MLLNKMHFSTHVHRHSQGETKSQRKGTFDTRPQHEQVQSQWIADRLGSRRWPCRCAEGAGDGPTGAQV